MIKYTEGSLYTLATDYYHKTVLTCTYIHDGFAYFINNKEINYKKNLKTNKLYIFNTQYQSWDNIEDTLKVLSDNEHHHHLHRANHFEFRGD